MSLSMQLMFNPSAMMPSTTSSVMRPTADCKCNSDASSVESSSCSDLSGSIASENSESLALSMDSLLTLNDSQFEFSPESSERASSNGSDSNLSILPEIHEPNSTSDEQALSGSKLVPVVAKEEEDNTSSQHKSLKSQHKNSSSYNNHRSNSRYSRRNNSHKKNRHYGSCSILTSTGYYPCSICCCGYSQMADYAHHQNYMRPFRPRSYSINQQNVGHYSPPAKTISQKSNTNGGTGGVNSVLSLSEYSYLYSNYRKRSSLYSLDSDECHILNIGQRSFDLNDARYDVLTFDQVRCLSSVLEQTVKVKSDLHVEVFEYSLMNLILAVKARLLLKGIVLYDIRLNGGAASHVLSLSSSDYNDIDLIFFVDLKDSDQFERVREAVLEVLLELIPSSICERRRVIETFVNKMVKVDEVDRWSLFSLLNYGGRNVELKFVDSMRRQYEFSVDSFQIVLDTLLQFSLVNSESNPMTYNFYPTVVGESVFGDFSEAMFHLHHRLIVTKKPEEIRGGGLLKYCSLLVRNFYPMDEQSVKVLEPYMSTRFFIDFYYYDCQRDRLKNYLTTHFGSDTMLKYNFMVIFYNIILRSSSLANHHASAMYDFETMTIECYSKLLADFLNLYLSGYSKVQEFFMRCQNMRVCRCPKHFRSCIHRCLNSVYSITYPLIVTYVDDGDNDATPLDERKRNLSKFVEVHDELFPIYGGYSFAFLPSCLFDCPDANHFVVSSSTLKSISSNRFMRPDPPPSDYMCTFLMKPANNGQQSIIQLIPMGVQNLLPESFYPVEHPNPNLISPALAFNFFPPISPPPSYRICIVNRIPIYHSETIASGPIFNSQIVAMHYPQPPAPMTQSGSMSNGVDGQSPVNMSQFNLSPAYPIMNYYSGHMHHHHHHHFHHGHHQNGSFGYYASSSYLQYMSAPSGHRSKKGNHHHQGSQAQQSGNFNAAKSTTPLEPLRIVYPRSPQNEDKLDLATSAPTVGGEDSNAQEEPLTAPVAGLLPIPQISINDNVISLNSNQDISDDLKDGIDGAKSDSKTCESNGSPSAVKKKNTTSVTTTA